MAAVPIIMGAGALMQGIGQIAGANSQANADQANAQAAQQNAFAAQKQAQLEEARQRIQSTKEIGGMRADYGASGVSSTSGSALDSLQESARNAELDAQTIRWGGNMKAMGYQNEATADMNAASGARTAGYLGAAGSLLSTGAKVYGMRRS